MALSFILAIIVSFLVSFLTTPRIRDFFIKHSWVEDPSKKQSKSGNATAQTSVPRGGGIPIFVAILISSLVFLPPDQYLIAILVAAFFTLIIGLIDDVYDISPFSRLLFNFLVALIIVASGIKISFISNPLGGIIDFTSYGPISSILTLLWIVWCLNIVGWAAGVEGQLPGFTSISAVIIGILSLKYSADITQWPTIILAGALAGSYLGFLPFNFFPQSIMPGYSGKSLAGFFLAVLSLLSGAKLATLVLLLGIPMLDAVFVIIRRLSRHRSPFYPDASHFHHQLLKIGWNRRQITYLYWAITLFFGAASLFLNSSQKFYTFLGLAILFSGITLKVFRRI